MQHCQHSIKDHLNTNKCDFNIPSYWKIRHQSGRVQPYARAHITLQNVYAPWIIRIQIRYERKIQQKSALQSKTVIFVTSWLVAYPHWKLHHILLLICRFEMKRTYYISIVAAHRNCRYMPYIFTPALSLLLLLLVLLSLL